jgi:small subunit ribosomal protein S8
MGVVTDPIADMLTRIRNANTANHENVDIPASRMKRAIAEILKEEGFIRSYEVVTEGPQGTLRVTLKYGPEKEKVITGLRRISRPGLRVYSSRTEIPRVLGGLGLVILSTSKGIMSGKRAKREGCGGEVLAYVW